MGIFRGLFGPWEALRERNAVNMGSTPWYRDRALCRMLSAQLSLTLGAPLVLWFWSDGIALAVFLGGTVCVGSTAYCGYRVFAAATDTPEVLLASFYRAEFGKLIIVGSLLATAMAALEGVNFIALCLAYVGVQICGSIFCSMTDVARQPG